MIACAALCGAGASAARTGFEPTRTLTVTDAVDALSADGTRAAFLYDGYSVDVWDARTAKRRGGGASDSGISNLTLAGDIVAYLTFEDTLSLHYRSVDTVALRRGIPTFFRVADLACARTCLGYVAGDSDVVVYNAWKVRGRGVEEAGLWRIEGRTSRPIVRGSGALYAEWVDRRRIAIRRPPRTAMIVTENGSPLARFTFAAPLRALRLGGASLAGLLRASIVVLDTRSGRVQRTWAVPPRARLEDVEAGLVVYTAGDEIHLRRVVDGRDRVIPLPQDARAPVHAQLEEDGLFYSWTLPPGPGGLLPRGRIAFAPMSAVKGLFES